MNTDPIYAIVKLLLALIALSSLIWATLSAQTYKTTQLGRLMLPGKIDEGENEFHITGPTGKLLAVILIRGKMLVFAEIFRGTASVKTIPIETVTQSLHNHRYKNKKTAVDYLRTLCAHLNAKTYTVGGFEEEYGVKLQT